MSLDKDGTLFYLSTYEGPINLYQSQRSELSKFRILSYSEIVVRGQNVIKTYVAMFEQLNDQLLVGSKQSLTPHH